METLLFPAVKVFRLPFSKASKFHILTFPSTSVLNTTRFNNAMLVTVER